MYSQDTPFLSHRERIEIGRKKLFDFPYPIFDENYRKDFETKLIRTFYMREIGFESEGLFKFNLETWLLVNMPYYNQLFESQNLKFDPLINTDVNDVQNKKKDRDEKINQTNNSTGKVDQTSNTTGKSDSTSHATSDSEGERFNRDLVSDTPDNRLAITTQDGKGVIEYASKIEEDKEIAKNSNVGQTEDQVTNEATSKGNQSSENESTGNQTSEANEIEDYIAHRVGKIGTTSYSQLVMEYRESFLRIENQVFRELQQLFMLVY